MVVPLQHSCETVGSVHVFAEVPDGLSNLSIRPIDGETLPVSPDITKSEDRRGELVSMGGERRVAEAGGSFGVYHPTR